MRTIKIDYRTQVEQRRYGQKLFVVETIRNLDEAIDQLCEAFTDQEKDDPFAEDLCPYFGVLWPSAEGLSQALMEDPALVKGKSVLELGCGLGLPALVASHLGGKVLATDAHPDVELFFKRNAQHSVVECDYRQLNWREDKSDIGQFDVVMGSDVLYESRHPHEVAQGLVRFLKPNGLILLSDPGRSYLQKYVSAMCDLGFEHQLEPQSVGKQDIFVFKFTQRT